MPAEERRRTRPADVVLSASFLLCIWLPLLDAKLALDPAAPLEENRRLAPWPAAAGARAGVGARLRLFEKWWDDHFGFRASLVTLNGIVKVIALGVSPKDDIVVGKGGWLFYAGNGALEAYLNHHPFTREQAGAWRSALVERRRRVAAAGAKLLVVIVPEKQTIYPEMLPDAIRPSPGPTRTDVVMAALQEDPAVDALDLRGMLGRAKAGRVVYLQRDSHWNDVGALLGSQAVLRRVARQWPSVVPPRLADHEVVPTLGVGDLARMAGLRRVLTQVRPVVRARLPRCATAVAPPSMRLRSPKREFAPQAYECPRPELPRMLMFHDSFAIQMIPFLAEGFSRSVFVRSDVHPFDAELAAAERADVVILELAERALVFPPG